LIITELYDGQGFGNQLWAYAVAKAIANEHKSEFAILSANRFKLRNTLALDWGKTPIHLNRTKPTRRKRTARFRVYHEQVCRHPIDGMDISEYDSNLMKLTRNWRIEGNFQSEKYILDVKNELMQDFRILRQTPFKKNVCIINLRGGEYKKYPSLFLKQEYYLNAMRYIKSISPFVEFEIVTDDVDLAKKYFPSITIRSRILSMDYSLEQKIIDDFSSIQNAEFLILSNSSFSWWGAWTNQNYNCVVAPKYWARHNIGDGFWSMGDSLTNGWHWLDNRGDLFSTDECESELVKFKKSNGYLEIMSK